MTHAAYRRGKAVQALVIVGVVALGFNLRPAVVSIGPVLNELIDGLGVSATYGGILTTLPVIVFAVVGLFTPWLVRSVGIHRATLVCLLGVIVGLVFRAWVDTGAAFLMLTLVALAGMAAANILLPPLVKYHYPNRIGPLTSLYTASLAVGITASSVLTVPVAHQFGSWRWGLFVWVFPALFAVLPWMVLSRRDSRNQFVKQQAGVRSLARSPLAWALAAFFGLQAMQFYIVVGWFAQVYRDAGFSAVTSGWLLGTITAMQIPMSIVMPRIAARTKHLGKLTFAIVACYPIGYTGLLIAPVQGAWLWAVLVGVGSGVFPLALTLIGLRARTSRGTVALSGFAQSTGYLIAAAGPVLIGASYDVTGGWQLPLSMLIVFTIPALFLAVQVARPRAIEDEVPELIET